MKRSPQPTTKDGDCFQPEGGCRKKDLHETYLANRSAYVFAHILHRYLKPLSYKPIQINQQVHVVMAVILFNRNSGVCGGSIVPALYPSSQPHQSGRDQRQAGVHEDRGAAFHG